MKENRNHLLKELERVLKEYEENNESELLSVTLFFSEPATYFWSCRSFPKNKFKRIKD